MSYTSNRQEIINYLNNQGYQEVPKVLDITKIDSKHKSFVLKPRAMPIRDGTGNVTYDTYLFELQVRYKNMNSKERDENFQLYIELINYFQQSGLGIENQDFNDEAERQYFSLAIIEFQYGAHGCGNLTEV